MVYGKREDAGRGWAPPPRRDAWTKRRRCAFGVINAKRQTDLSQFPAGVEYDFDDFGRFGDVFVAHGRDTALFPFHQHGDTDASYYFTYRTLWSEFQSKEINRNRVVLEFF